MTLEEIIKDIQAALDNLRCVGEQPDAIYMPQAYVDLLKGYRVPNRLKGNAHQRRIKRRRIARFRNYFKKTI